MKKLLLILLLIAHSVMAAPPVTVVVPWPPGGQVDMFGRNVARYLASTLQQDFVVVNKVGADGRIGMDYVANQAADGLHLLISNTSATLFNRVLFNKLNHDSTAFDNMVPMIRSPLVLAVSNRLSVTTFNDFLKIARSRPLNCAGSGASTVFVGKYMFKQLGLADIQFVPFRGTNDMIPQLISGNIDCAFETRFLSAALASEQKIRILAVSGLARDPIAPDGKLFSDIIPALTFYNWSGVSISKSIPQIERDRIFSALRRMPQDKAYRTSMDSLGVEVVENPMVNDTWLNSEYQRFETMRQQIGLSKID